MASELETSTLRLKREIDVWRAHGQVPQMFLRDDDAIDDTPELRQLTTTVERWDIPLLLAVIPKFATSKLSKFVDAHNLITPAMHGYSHINHSPINMKKCEFGDERSLDAIIQELENGRELLRGLFPYKLSNLFVPPWNRIGEKAMNACRLVGFEGISGYGWKKVPDEFKFFNTHVDVIDWKNKKSGKTTNVIIADLCRNFETSRLNGYPPIGLLTHHLVHDENIWGVLDEVFKILDTNEIKWISPRFH